MESENQQLQDSINEHSISQASSKLSNKQPNTYNNNSSLSFFKDNIGSFGDDTDQLAPSKVQQLISELFRINLCRNDDHNLALSSVIKNIAANINQPGSKKKGDSKDKLILDLRGREEER
jgi:hypothetical protein